MPLYKYKINIHINKQILILNNRFLNNLNNSLKKLKKCRTRKKYIDGINKCNLNFH